MESVSRKVAVIGGGVGGICAARECLRENLKVTVFDRASAPGGQWSLEDCSSGVFESLVTNIPWTELTFSDVPPLRDRPDHSLGDNSSLFLTAKQFSDYISHVIDITPGLRDCFRLQCTVTSVQRSSTLGYQVKWVKDGVESSEVFDRVVIATGRSQEPLVPQVDGIEKFPGQVIHAKEYRSPKKFAGQRVLVVGGFVSATECAGDLANAIEGERPSRVIMATRLPRHYISKQRDDSSYTHILFNNISMLKMRSGAASVPEECARIIPLLWKYSKNVDYNLPDLPPEAPAVAVQQKFLDEAKKGDVLKVKKAEIERVDENGNVFFSDGSKEVFDSIIFGTGYSINLPFLAKSVQENIFARDMKGQSTWLDLYLHTWHHDLPGVAFLGLYEVAGGVIAAFETQARWIARVFANDDKVPSTSEIKAGIAQWIATRRSPEFAPYVFSNIISHDFAEKVGCDVDYNMFPELSLSLLSGPFVPEQFRLCGYGALDNGLENYKKAARMCGVDFERMYADEDELLEIRKAYEAFRKKDCIPKGLDTAYNRLLKKNQSS